MVIQWRLKTRFYRIASQQYDHETRGALQIEAQRGCGLATGKGQADDLARCHKSAQGVRLSAIVHMLWSAIEGTKYVGESAADRFQERFLACPESKEAIVSLRNRLFMCGTTSLYSAYLAING